MTITKRLIFFFSLIILAGCTQTQPAVTAEPTTPFPTSTPLPTQTPTPTPTPIPTVFGGYKADRLIAYGCAQEEVCVSSLDGTNEVNISSKLPRINQPSSHVVSWSADGKWILLLYSSLDGNRANWGLWASTPNGSEQHLVKAYEEAKLDYFNINFKPDSSQFIVGNRSSTEGQLENNEIVILDAKDSSMVSTGHFGYDPQYSPDGKSYAYLSAELPKMNLYVVNEGDSEPVLVASYNFPNTFEGIGDFVWKPDGSGLIYSTGNQINEVNLDGSDPVMLLENKERVFVEYEDIAFHSSHPRFSTDGKYLTCSYEPKPRTISGTGLVDLRQKKIYFSPEQGGLYWTPDDHLILKTFDEENNKTTILLMNPETKETTPIEGNDWLIYSIQP